MRKAALLCSVAFLAGIVSGIILASIILRPKSLDVNKDPEDLSSAIERANMEAISGSLSKSNPPILEKALEKENVQQKINASLKRLRDKNIWISKIYWVSEKEAIEFLTKLQFCEECQKTFAPFGTNKVLIMLHTKNEVNDSFVFIDARKNPKEITRWLATGKE